MWRRCWPSRSTTMLRSAESAVARELVLRHVRVGLRTSDRESAEESLKLALEPAVADGADLQRQADALGRAHGRRAGGLGGALGQPQHPRVVTEVLIAQLGVAVEPELADHRVLER